MDTYSQAAWEHLGTALKERRVALGYGYRKRGDFARDTGMGAKTLQRLENGERSFYPAETIAQAEAAYQLEPGSFADCLRGARLRPLTRSAEEIAPSDEWEIAVMARTELPYAVRQAAIRGHRELVEQEAEKLASLGIAPPPAFLRGGIRRLAGESPSNDEARQA